MIKKTKTSTNLTNFKRFDGKIKIPKFSWEENEQEKSERFDSFWEDIKEDYRVQKLKNNSNLKKSE